MARGGGNRRGGTAARGGAVANTRKGWWMPSVVMDEQLEGLAGFGFLPRWADVNWRAPVQEGVSTLEAEPGPHPHELVLLTPFVLRGLSLPLHDFFRRLLFY